VRAQVFPWDGRLSDGGDGAAHPIALELAPTVLAKLEARQEAAVAAE
jgi:hypothetical protein